MILEENKTNKRKKSRRFPIRKTPELINILLKDRTTNKNIIWGTDNYIGMGKDFLPQSQMKEKWIVNGGNRLVQPRMKKHVKTQSIRTRENAEVFTPIWIVKKQNDLVEEEFKNLPLDYYVDKVWLEITCGEAPYMCTRYDTVSGEPIELWGRVGFVDRKLQRISKEIDGHDDWINYATRAIKSSYGYELQGDSLLIARENILYTFIDYYKDKFKKIPEIKLMKDIATIVSYNLFQMDGVKYVVPYSEEIQARYKDLQLNLFDENSEREEIEVIEDGTKALIKNWFNTKKNIDFERITLGGNNMKFDVVIGNPPYQDEAVGTSTSDDPIYHLFMEQAYSIADKVCLITPARFLFNAGKTPKSWNKKMLQDTHFKVAHFIQKSSGVFKNTDIKGGIAITYRDKDKNFGEIGVFTSFKELNTIRKKVISNNNFKDIMSIINTQNRFDLDVLYKDYPEYKSIIGSKGKDKRLRQIIMERLPDIFTENKKDNSSYKILGLIERQRSYRYVPKKYIEDNGVINKYKVFVASANGSGVLGEVLSTPLIGEPLVGITQTFISFGKFETKLEAEAMLKYVKTKFVRTLLGVLKITQGNNRNTWANVPIQDFTSNSDIDWAKSISDIDKQLYKKYKLSKEEIDFIENNVKEMV